MTVTEIVVDDLNHNHDDDDIDVEQYRDTGRKPSLSTPPIPLSSSLLQLQLSQPEII